MSPTNIYRIMAREIFGPEYLLTFGHQTIIKREDAGLFSPAIIINLLN